MSLKLTSVKIDESLWERFKHQCINDKFSFQKLAAGAIFLYLTDSKFRELIRNQNDTTIND
jgi:hypothetical protein